MTLQKMMPTGSGLGSSGASCAAAAFAVNALLPEPLPKMDLIKFAMEGERLATGAAHADNVAPSLLGGICLVRSYNPLDVIQLPHKNIFYWVVVHPHMIIHTKTARDLLPRNIPLSVAIEQTGNVSALITGLAQGNVQLISDSLKDGIAEPVRAPLIPGYYDIKQSALDAGAVGFSISGSGPSVFALTTSSLLAEKVAKTIMLGFAEHAHVDSDIYISKINQLGTRIVSDTE
jgi:homoserine kinase